MVAAKHRWDVDSFSSAVPYHGAQHIWYAARSIFALICLSLYIEGTICHPAMLWLQHDVWRTWLVISFRQPGWLASWDSLIGAIWLWGWKGGGGREEIGCRGGKEHRNRARRERKCNSLNLNVQGEVRRYSIFTSDFASKLHKRAWIFKVMRIFKRFHWECERYVWLFAISAHHLATVASPTTPHMDFPTAVDSLISNRRMLLVLEKTTESTFQNL